MQFYGAAHSHGSGRALPPAVADPAGLLWNLAITYAEDIKPIIQTSSHTEEFVARALHRLRRKVTLVTRPPRYHRVSLHGLPGIIVSRSPADITHPDEGRSGVEWRNTRISTTRKRRRSETRNRRIGGTRSPLSVKLHLRTRARARGGQRLHEMASCAAANEPRQRSPRVTSSPSIDRLPCVENRLRG